MLEELISWTSLPNLHPLMVHFPIALLPTALLLDFLGLFYRRFPWLDRAATALYLAAGLGAGAAFWAGRRAADSLTDVPPRVQPHIAQHSDWALYTLWAVGVLAVLRLAVAVWELESRRAAARTALLAAALAATGLLLWTADLGGRLVYQDGVAVAAPQARRQAQAVESPRPPARQLSTPPAQQPARTRLIRAADGTLVWTPLAEDADALGQVLTAAPGSTAGAVSWKEPTGGLEGLHLEVDGRTVLLLPGDFGDAHVEAKLAADAFRGRLGLAHHVQDDYHGGFFTLSSPDGKARLVSARGAEEEVLSESQVELPSGTFRLAVSAAGRHLKGSLGGATLVHGHEPPTEGGSCGLLLDGQGTVRILWVRVTPLEE